MDRFKNLHVNNQKTLKIWIYTLKLYGINMFNDAPSWAPVIVLPVIVLLYPIYILKDLLVAMSTSSNLYRMLIIFVMVDRFTWAFHMISVSYALVVHGKKIEAIIISIDELWSKVGSPRHNKYFRSMNILFKGTFLCVVVTAIFWVLLLLEYMTSSVALKHNEPERSKTFVFYIILLIGTPDPLISIFCVSYRCLMGTITINASMLFLSLQTDLENVIEILEAQDAELRESELEERIKQLICYHQKIIKITYHIKDVYSVQLFFDVLAASTILAFDVFGVMAIYDRVGGLKSTWKAVIEFLSLLISHWSGQLIADMSEGVALAAYSSRWYSQSRRITTLLNVIMIRSQSPIRITAWVTVINMENLSLIMQEAWSYISILISLWGLVNKQLSTK